MDNIFQNSKEKNSHSYDSGVSAERYLRYVKSFDGKTERDAIWKSIANYLPESGESKILDAACGTGWLSRILAKKYKEVVGFDSSKKLLEYARKNQPSNCVFLEGDVLKEIPHSEKKYDAAIFCLATHDVENPKEAYLKILNSLSDGGRLIVVLANPYYSFPVGSWKRSFLGKIFGGKTKLKLDSYNNFARKEKRFNWKGEIPSYFHTLPETINGALEAGFSLKKMEEIRIDDGKFLSGRKRQLYLYPMLLMLVLKK